MLEKNGPTGLASLFVGELGVAHTLIEAFGESATLRRGRAAANRSGGAPVGEVAGARGGGSGRRGAAATATVAGGLAEGEGEASAEERCRFVRAATRRREGGLTTSPADGYRRGASAIRGESTRVEGLLSTVGLRGAPDVGVDSILLDRKPYRLEAADPIVVEGEVVAYQIVARR